MENKLKILIVSSASPYFSANYGYCLATLLKDRGHEVDYLTRFQFEAMKPWMYSVYPQQHVVQTTFKWNFYLIIKTILTSPLESLEKVGKKLLRRKQYHLDLEDEHFPPVPSNELIRAIPDKQYDLVIIQYRQTMLSADSLIYIYNKLHCPIYMFSPDLNPMTGGCDNIFDCRNFLNECKNCPATLLKNRSSAHRNYLYKKEVYSKIDCKIFGNTWMIQWYKQSGLFHDDQIAKIMCMVDERVFKNINKKEARQQLNLPQDKFILFCGASYIREKRKGFGILQQATSAFARKYNGAKNCLLIVAGRQCEEVPKLIEMDVNCVGFLPMEKLALMYAAADVYLSPSLQDAGPSMVNQSLMCGTPVIAFNIGVAIDIVRTGETGYLARYNNADDFFQGMVFLYEHPDKESLHYKSHQLAMELFARNVIGEYIEKVYTEHIKRKA